MKKYSYVGVAFIILIFGIYAVPKIVDRFTVPKLALIGKAPAFQFKNQNDILITNANYEGKVYLVEFFFTTCPTICPIMNKNMVKIQNEFYARQDFGIVSISINPEYDTPQVLKDYALNQGATSVNWNFLTGEKTAIYQLANEGFGLYAGENSDAEGGFEHSGMFALIDKKGNIRSRFDEYGNPIAFYDGLDSASIKNLIEDISIVIKE